MEMWWPHVYKRHYLHPVAEMTEKEVTFLPMVSLPTMLVSLDIWQVLKSHPICQWEIMSIFYNWYFSTYIVQQAPWLSLWLNNGNQTHIISMARQYFYNAIISTNATTEPTHIKLLCLNTFVLDPIPWQNLVTFCHTEDNSVNHEVCTIFYTNFVNAASLMWLHGPIIVLKRLSIHGYAYGHVACSIGNCSIILLEWQANKHRQMQVYEV